MASAATNLLAAELVIVMTIRPGTDKDSSSTQILFKAFPLAIPALNIRVNSIWGYTATAHSVLLEIEEFRIRHPINNRAH